MSDTYTEIPEKYEDIDSLFITDLKEIIQEFIFSKRISFYDTCSFRRHANLEQNGRNRIINYFKQHDSIIVFTRVILMELASCSGVINKEYIDYLNDIVSSGVKVILLNEEHIFEVMSECFSANAKVNEYLTWAVRVSRSPVSTITKTLMEDSRLLDEVVKSKNSNKSDVYRRFFTQVRSNKEHNDNLGEELIGICVYILSHLPGIKDGKICILTDDKGAAGKLWAMYRRTNSRFRGAQIMLLSTPKMVQFMYQEGMGLTKQEMTEIFSKSASGNIVVMGTTAYDLEVDEAISMTADELAEKIIEPNGINIVF